MQLISLSPTVLYIRLSPFHKVAATCPTREHCSLPVPFVLILGTVVGNERVERRGDGWYARFRRVRRPSSHSGRYMRQFEKTALNSLFTASFCLKARLCQPIFGTQAFNWDENLGGRSFVQYPFKRVIEWLFRVVAIQHQIPINQRILRPNKAAATKVMMVRFLHIHSFDKVEGDEHELFTGETVHPYCEQHSGRMTVRPWRCCAEFASCHLVTHHSLVLFAVWNLIDHLTWMHYQTTS